MLSVEMLLNLYEYRKFFDDILRFFLFLYIINFRKFIKLFFCVEILLNLKFGV